MPHMTAVLRNLRSQRDDLQSQIERLDNAISTLAGLDGRRGRRGGPRHLSAAARNRIAAAQRARWAKWKAAHKRK
jgi:hypothetical protein